jgi:CRISPR-associated exonuclease Cas4
MFFLFALIAAALAWFVGRGLFARTGLPTREILYADVGSTFPQPAPLISKRYRLSGKPDYLVRVKGGIAPVELKSSRSPSSGRPYDGHLFQLAAYCLLVEDVCRVSVPYGLVKYEDRTIRVEYTPSLRASLLALLDEMRTAMRHGECHINHNQPSKCRSCGFSSVCGEGLI